MIPMEVATEEPDEISTLLGQEPESRFYTCHVCGDNWLSVKETEDTGHCKITFVHQMGMAPVLKRIAHMDTEVILNDSTVASWTYFLDDQEIDQEVWFDKLSKRRKILKSICSN
ncbi:MAG: hypothetical protein ACE5G0_19610 [Rhodothermales bacterium]